MPQTMTEKILSAKAGRSVSPGEFILAEADVAYAHDGTAPLAIKVMEENPFMYRVAHPERVVLVIDHASPPPHVEAARVHTLMRRFARRFGTRLYDVGEGICHQVIAESGLVRPGSLVIGADSHTVTLGALAAFATGVGSTDIALVFAFGATWLRVPEAVRGVITGEPHPAVGGKDAVLDLLRQVRADGLTYKAIEFVGDGLRHLSVEQRMTVSNMVVEAGAKAGIFPADEVLLSWLGDGAKPLHPDPGAEYVDEVVIDLSSLEPMVAEPPNVDRVRPVTDLEGIEVNQVFIGSCTNGRYEDFVIAARILRGRRVKEGVRCIAVPASRRVYMRLLAEGVVEELVRAGCFVAHSTCGPCIGAHLGILDAGEVAVSTSNRNFPGRMGHKDSRIYLASPATAAASAVEGVIADPRKYLS